MKIAKLILALFLVSAAAAQLSAWERLDEIVAVIGDKVVLSSELDDQARMYALQTGVKIDSDDQLLALKRELLRQMINDRLILFKALEDTTIKVSDDEIESAFQQRLQDLQRSFASPEEFDRQLAAEGLTLRELKTRLREEVKDQIYKEKLISRLLSRVSVTRTEVEDFFRSYGDSLPNHPRSVKLAHLLLRPSTSEHRSDSLREQAQALAARIAAGESFEDLAREFSNDVSAEKGGDIGTFAKGDLLPEFEEAALALSPGQVSGVVKTKLGYHIVKLVSKQADMFHAKHILLMEQASSSDSTRVSELASRLVDSLASGADWGSLVKDYSDDETSKATFGELGWFAIEDLPLAYQRVLARLEPGEISEPFWAEEGLQILKLLDRKEERPFSLEEDWDILKEYTRRQKSASVITEIVDEMKEKVYLEIRGL